FGANVAQVPRLADYPSERTQHAVDGAGLVACYELRPYGVSGRAVDLQPAGAHAFGVMRAAGQQRRDRVQVRAHDAPCLVTGQTGDVRDRRVLVRGQRGAGGQGGVRGERLECHGWFLTYIYIYITYSIMF